MKFIFVVIVGLILSAYYQKTKAVEIVPVAEKKILICKQIVSHLKYCDSDKCQENDNQYVKNGKNLFCLNEEDTIYGKKH